MSGKLFGVGVGPGDPELLTLKAKRVIEEADYLAVPVSLKEKESFALSIVQDLIEKEKPILKLFFPMIAEEDLLQKSWAEAVEEIQKVLQQEKNVAFLTLGDPSFYSTYMYIYQAIARLGYQTEVVPGVTSFCACACRAGISLGENKETIAVIPSSASDDKLEQVLDTFDNIVFLKAAKNIDRLKKTLENKNLEDKAVVVSKCGTAEEKIKFGLDEDEEFSYFTTIIVKRNGLGAIE